MSYTTAEYEAAAAELERRRTEAERQQAMRHNEVASKHPEILEIENEMTQAALSTIKALGMGEGSVQYVRQLEQESLAAQNKRADLLEKNGYPRDYLKIKYHCPVCSDRGFAGGKMCRCHKLILRSISYEKISSTYPVDKCTFDCFDLNYYPDSGSGITPRRRMENVFGFCRKYAADFGTDSASLLLQGETGLGKTHLSLAIAGEVIKRGYGVIYASAQNILSRLENEKFGRVEFAETESNLLECDLLILDDLGSEFTTQFTVSSVYNIINSRLLNGKPTIISTNLSLEDIQQKYSPRIASRILSEYVLLQFDGTDIRQIITR